MTKKRGRPEIFPARHPEEYLLRVSALTIEIIFRKTLDVKAEMLKQIQND